MVYRQKYAVKLIKIKGRLMNAANMKTCPRCGQSAHKFSFVSGVCGECVSTPVDHKKRDEQDAAIREMLVTTEMYCPDLKIIERKGVVSAEVVVGMNLFKDMLASIRNLVGGRSGVVQNALSDIRYP